MHHHARQFTLAAGGIVVDGGRVLMIRRGTPPFPGYWAAPGGRLEPGELVEEAALREVAEETGLTCAIVGLLGLRQMIDEAGENNLQLYFLLRPLSGTVAADGREVLECRWMDRPEIEATAEMFPPARALALLALQGVQPLPQGRLMQLKPGKYTYYPVGA